MLADGGRELLNSPVANYSDGNLDAVREMLLHPTSAFGLGDGGAHAGQTCDASTTTFLLTHWARDRAEGRLPVELAVHKTTQATATLYGLGDRGVLGTRVRRRRQRDRLRPPGRCTARPRSPTCRAARPA